MVEKEGLSLSADSMVSKYALIKAEVSKEGVDNAADTMGK